MSGVELVRELAPRLPGTKIVMLTMSSTDRDVAEAMRYGASEYLTKDLSLDALARRSGPRRPASWLSPGASPTGFSRDFLRRRVVAEPDGEAFLDRLTTRERDILRLLADGLGDRDISTALTISRRTV